MQLPLWFTLAFISTITAPAILGGLSLNCFAPFLCLSYTKKNFVYSLWLSLFCGLIIDLLSTEYKFGLMSLAYSIAAAIMYRYCRFFSNTKSFSLCLYVIIFSSLLSIINIFLLSSFIKHFNLSLVGIITDVIVMPILDGVYTLLLFILPTVLFNTTKGWFTRMYYARQND